MQQPSTPFLQALGHGPADRRLAILRGIGAHGSISQAARAAGVSYKAAWQALDTLTNLAGVPLVQRVVGGAGGGGARLTPAGQELLAAADAMHAARTQLAAHWAPGGGAQAAALRLSVQTSMRKQWPCTVRALHASGFELGLALLALPLAAALLHIPLWHALGLEVGFLLFMLLYTLAYNWGYDALRRAWVRRHAAR